jgi:probable HAF family extracellular repeat protein
VVVGHAANLATGGNYPVAVVWDQAGTATHLTGEGISGAFVAAINDDGLMVGASDSFAGTVNSQGGFTIDSAGILNPLGERFAPRDVDSSGRMVGSIFEPAIGYVAGSWDQGTTLPLGSLNAGQPSDAYATNNAGVTVGRSDSQAGPIYAVKWANGTITNLGGAPGAQTSWPGISEAHDVNETGLIIGNAYVNAFTIRAARWTGTGNGADVLSLQAGFVTSFARSVNDSGTIVGYAARQGEGARASVWLDDQAIDLNDLIDPASGWYLESATDINNRGQIVGYGWHTDHWVGFRLDPICDPLQHADFDGDCQVDVRDLNLMHLQGLLLDGVAVEPGLNDHFDLNGDLTINLSDVHQWLAAAAAIHGQTSPYRSGDANLDGVVDGQDFNAWNANKFTARRLWSDGNFNGDGVIDGQDFNAWNANKFTSSSAITVPEPSAWLLTLIFSPLAMSRPFRPAVRVDG